LDSPATTSPVTYTLYFKTDNSGNTSLFNFRNGGAETGMATMTLMEIAA
jgi:hypothetical protein